MNEQPKTDVLQRHTEVPVVEATGVQCPACRGARAEFPGHPRTEKCEYCDGEGMVNESRVLIVSPTVRPPAHPFYGDSYDRGTDPFHVSAAPPEFRDASIWHHGDPRGGWFLLDAYGHEIGWIPDGMTFPIPDSTVSEHSEIRSEA